MRLNRFLLEDWPKYDEPRSKTITLDEAVDFATKNCKDALGGTIIRRQLYDNWQDQYRLTDPKSGSPRVSRNTTNYYTLIIDNSPNWKKYPKRSRSIICGIGKRQGSFWVFPENGAKIGVCPVYDFWGCFGKQGIPDMAIFNEMVEKFVCRTTKKCERFDDKIASIKLEFRLMDKFKKEFHDKFKELTGGLWKDEWGGWMRPYVDDPNLKMYDFIEGILDPNKNGFKLTKAGAKISGNKEVWTDGKALLVREGTGLDNFLDRMGKKRRGEGLR